MNASDYIALTALLVSIIGIVLGELRERRLAARQMQLHEKQERLAREQLKLAQADVARQTRAEIAVALEGSVRGGAKFYLRNRGAATARDVTLSVEARGEMSAPIPTAIYERYFPVREMYSGHEIAVLAALSTQTGTSFDCRWSWENPDGMREERRGMVTLLPR